MTPIVTSSAETDEHPLTERTQAGDSDAFTQLVRKYHDRLYRHIKGRVR